MSTLKDVAERAGVTVTTVSRVINNRGYISEKTRQKVYDVMKEIGYQPNEVARSLSKQHTSTIGVIVPHIVHPYFAKLLSNIESAAVHVARNKQRSVTLVFKLQCYFSTMSCFTGALKAAHHNDCGSV